VLVQGLRDTALAEPADPIDSFAKWLLHRQDVEGQWTEFREKAEYLANLEAELRRLEAGRGAAAEKLRTGEEEEERHEPKPPDEAEEIDTSAVSSESLSETF
jgi:hypothetical protein